jgi:hypothetical protein
MLPEIEPAAEHIRFVVKIVALLFSRRNTDGGCPDCDEVERDGASHDGALLIRRERLVQPGR